MLEYVKTILQKVSFNRHLFEKELKKALASLAPKEIKSLRDWCYQKFGEVYQAILNRCFVTA